MKNFSTWNFFQVESTFNKAAWYRTLLANMGIREEELSIAKVSMLLSAAISKKAFRHFTRHFNLNFNLRAINLKFSTWNSSWIHFSKHETHRNTESFNLGSTWTFENFNLNFIYFQLEFQLDFNLKLHLENHLENQRNLPWCSFSSIFEDRCSNVSSYKILLEVCIPWNFSWDLYRTLDLITRASSSNDAMERKDRTRWGGRARQEFWESLECTKLQC